MNPDEFYSELEKTSSNNLKLKYAFTGYLLSVNFMLEGLSNKYKEIAQQQINAYIALCMNELNKESQIIDLMKKFIEKCNSEHCSDYFENSNEYILFVSILKKLSNSLVVREMNLNQIVNEFNRLITYNAFTSNTTVDISSGYMSEHDYDVFLDTLKTL